MFVNGVELAALDGIEEDLGSLLNTLEEAIVFSAAGSCLLVRVMAEDLLAMCALDLLLGCLVAIFGDTKDSIVILSLFMS